MQGITYSNIFRKPRTLKKIASLLFLDVAKAFDNIVHEWLLYNLYKRKINEQIIK